MKSLLKNIWIFLLFLIVTAVYSYSFFTISGFMTASDTFFHASRALSMTNILFSPVNFLSFKGGLPIAQFYPGLTYLPMSILLLFQEDIGFLNSFKIYLFILTLLTLYSCYFVGKRVKNETAGFIFAFLYTFSIYRTINLFVRMALGELIAMAILPLVIYGFYELFFGDKKKWYILSVSVSLLSYTHLLITFATFIFLAIFFLIYICVEKLDDIKERVVALLYAAGTSVLLSLAFIVPFIEQFSFQEIYTTYAWLPQGEKITTLLEVMFFNRIDIFTSGIIVFLLMIYLAFHYLSLNRWQKYLFLMGVLCFIITTDFFPWEFFNKTPLKNFQFAWRFNTFVTLFSTFAFSIYIGGFSKWWKKASIILLPIVLIVHIQAWSHFKNNPPQNYAVWEMTSDSAIPVVNGSTFYRDYTNININSNQESHDSVQEHQYFLNGEQVQVVEETTSEQVRILLKNHQEGANLQLPLFRYKGQVVIVNGQEVEATISKKGLTQIKVPAGDLEIVVKYRYTLSAVVAFIISLTTALILTFSILGKTKADDISVRRRKYRQRIV